MIELFSSAPPPKIKLPAVMPPNKPFLAPEQIRVFVPAIYQTPFAVPALLALSSLRASEIQALDWSNIPPNPEFIRVSGAVVPDEHHKMTRKAQNKNAASARNVPVMIPELAAALERDRQPAGSVLLYGQNSLRRTIRKVCLANGLPDVGIYGLWHPYVKPATKNFLKNQETQTAKVFGGLGFSIFIYCLSIYKAHDRHRLCLRKSMTLQFFFNQHCLVLRT